MDLNVNTIEKPIKHTWGGRRPGAGRKKTPSKTLTDAIDNLDIEGIFKRLEDWSKGQEVVCPHCMEKTGRFTADTVALQSAIELLNRRLGKVPQSVNVDITERIQLDADQIAGVISKNLYGFLDYLAMNHPVELAQYVEERKLLPGGD